MSHNRAAVHTEATSMISVACSEINETNKSIRFPGDWAALAGGILETFRETSSRAESVVCSDKTFA